MHIVGAIFFFLLAATSGAYGFIQLFSTPERTVFGVPQVSPALPMLQFGLSILFIVIAIAAARACAHCCKSHLADRDAGA